MNGDKTVAAIKRYRTRKIAGVAAKAYFLHRRKNRQAEMYNYVFNQFVALGGVYIKFLQGVLLRSEGMKLWVSDDIFKIFENLDSEPLNIGDVLKKELKPTQLAQLAVVQPQPFAAGSFGQVYYGQMRDGSPVIIKVLRPLVRELLKHDLRLLTTFTKNFPMHGNKNISYDFSQALQEFKQATLRETDYKEEATFAHELYEHYQDHPLLKIPKTYIDLCTENLIVQEYIDGVSAAQLIKLKAQGVDPADYVKQHTGSDLGAQLETIGYESMIGVFRLPRIMGDPHPGNVRFLPGNQVGVIDFGISARSPKDKAAFLGLINAYGKIFSGDFELSSAFEQFLRFFVNDLYRALKKLSLFLGKDAEANFANDVGKVAQDTFTKVVGSKDLNPLIEDGSILKSINEIVNNGNRFGIIVKLEASEVLRAAQTLITLMDSLSTKRGQIMSRVFKRVAADVEVEFPELMHDQEPTLSFNSALETVSNWLERVADRDPQLFQQLMQKIRLKSEPKTNKSKPAKVRSKV
jgi:hypothetical protein